MNRARILAGLVVALLGISVVTLLRGASEIFSKPYELMHGEGMTSLTANRVGQGLSLYPEVTSTQLITNPYTPVYMLLTGWLSSFFGESLLTGRVVALVCGLLICGVVFLLVRKLTGNPWASLISALLVTSLSVFRFLSVIYRMDTMGVVLSLVGIYMFIRYEGRGRLVFWSIPFFLLAFFTKQNFIAAPIAVGIYLLIKTWRIAFGYTWILVGSFFLLLVLGGLLTNGQMLVHAFLYMWYSLVEGGVWTWGLAHSQEILVSYYPLWISFLLYFGYVLVSKKKLLSLVNIYFVVVGLILIGLTGKGGSAFHYALETFSIGCVLIGILLAKVFESFSQDTRTLKEILLGVAVISLVLFQTLGWPLGKGYDYPKYMDETEESNWKVVDYVKDSGKPVLSYQYSVVTLAENGEANDLYDPALLIIGYLTEREHFGWDQSETVRRLETGYYGLVLLDFDLRSTYGPTPSPSDMVYLRYPRVTEEMAVAIRGNYDLVYVSGYMGSPFYPYQSFLFGYNGGQ